MNIPLSKPFPPDMHGCINAGEDKQRSFIQNIENPFIPDVSCYEPLPPPFRHEVEQFISTGEDMFRKCI